MSNNSLADICRWGLANALHQKYGLENAVLSKQTGSEIKSIPFGSSVNVNQQSLLGNFGQVAIAALGLGAGALGVAHLAGLINPPPAVVEPPAVVQPVEKPTIPPATVKAREIPLTIEWEFVPDESVHTHEHNTKTTTKGESSTTIEAQK